MDDLMDKIVITLDEVSGCLQMRWIACYMIYDWNYRHADNAFYNNQIARRKKVIERLKAVDEINDKFVTEIYNRVLAEDVEDFIQNHMRVQNCDRVQVEIEIAEAMRFVCNYYCIHRDKKTHCNCRLSKKYHKACSSTSGCRFYKERKS